MNCFLQSFPEKEKGRLSEARYGLNIHFQTEYVFICSEMSCRAFLKKTVMILVKERIQAGWIAYYRLLLQDSSVISGR